MTSIRAIFFDIGGVVIKDKGMKEASYNAFGINGEQEKLDFWNLINLDLLPSSRGERSLYVMWKEIAQKLNKTIDDSILKDLWISDFKNSILINEKVFQLVKNLKRRYRIGVVSNTIQEHADILTNMGVYKPFETLVLSHEVGIAKDNHEIFDIALKRLDVKPEDSIYIDDFKKYVDIASENGINGIHFISYEQLVVDLGEFGIKGV